MIKIGYKVTDGKAFDASAPSGQVINDGDLYRIGGWNGFAIGAKDASQTDRAMSFECDPAAIWSVKVPSGLSPAVGDELFWTTNDVTTFQKGDTHLVAKASAVNGQLPCAQALSTKNSAGYVMVRVMQSPGDAIKFGT